MTDEWEPKFEFSDPCGPWFRWFAWHPTKTTDRGWRWLRTVWRRRYSLHSYLEGAPAPFFATQIATPPGKSPEILESEGFDYRPQFGSCPSCGVPELLWCLDDCKLLDPVDNR